MPRGRHRHSPPLHRLLTPTAVAVPALACAVGSWLVGEPGIDDTATVVLRGLTAAAAAAAVVGGVLLRRWDKAAGRSVAELRMKRASLEWRAEERQAELEGEAEEAAELRARLEEKLRAKRAELARLRSEHAALLRRYAHAESERASALEGRRKLEIEASEPTRALTAAATDHRHASGAPTPLTYLQASEALRHFARNAAHQREQAEERRREEAAAARAAEARREAEERAAAPPALGPAAPFPPSPALPEPRTEQPQRFDFFGAGDAASRPEPEGPPQEEARPSPDEQVGVERQDPSGHASTPAPGFGGLRGAVPN